MTVRTMHATVLMCLILPTLSSALSTLPIRNFTGAVTRPNQDGQTHVRKRLLVLDKSAEELKAGISATFPTAPSIAPVAPELSKAKREAARETYKLTIKAFQEGKADAEKVYLWSRRWMEAERDSSDKNTDRVAAIEAQVERMKDLRKLAEVRYQAGQATQADVLGADFYIAEARLWQAQMKTD